MFWATWCKPCKEGLKQLRASKAKLKSAGTRVVLINFEEQAETVKGFIQKNHTPFPIVLDPYGRSKKAFLEDGTGKISLPRTVIVGRDGKVIRIIGLEGEDYVEQILN